MNTPMRHALMLGVGLFISALIVGWFLAIWQVFSSWGQLMGFALLVAFLGGFLSWVRRHIQALNERITQLSFELDKLRKKQ